MAESISRQRFRSPSYCHAFFHPIALGAKGEGLDITSAKVQGNKIVVSINRKKLNGAMVAHLKAPDTMDVTISVKVSDRLIPVIGMTLQRSRRIGSK